MQKRDGQIVYNLSPELVPDTVHKALACILAQAPPNPFGRAWGVQPSAAQTTMTGGPHQPARMQITSALSCASSPEPAPEQVTALTPGSPHHGCMLSSCRQRGDAAAGLHALDLLPCLKLAVPAADGHQQGEPSSAQPAPMQE